VVTILNQIYEEDFRDFSDGFRPGRSQHQALDALYVGITRKKVNWCWIATFGAHNRKAAVNHFGEQAGDWLWQRFTVHHTPRHGS
jgi:hypothetical protein